MGARVLLVDDSATIRNQIRSALRDAFEVEEFFDAEDGMQGFKALVEKRPDLVVCDLVMPVFDGAKFLAMRSTRPELLQVPVIILTAETDTDRKADLLERGASDYVTKPFNVKELLARVRVHYRVKVLQDELRRANSRLESLAASDGLTGLYNRRHFDRLLLDEHQRTLRYKRPVSLVLLDLDHFKQVNDTYGHAMGDEVLRNVGRIVATAVRVIDTASRYGGEEFALLLPETDSAGARVLAERLRTQMASATHTHDGAAIQKTASFGIATFDASGELFGPEELVKRADQALYQAKHGGRNRVVTWQRPDES